MKAINALVVTSLISLAVYSTANALPTNDAGMITVFQVKNGAKTVPGGIMGTAVYTASDTNNPPRHEYVEALQDSYQFSWIAMPQDHGYVIKNLLFTAPGGGTGCGYSILLNTDFSFHGFSGTLDNPKPAEQCDLSKLSAKIAVGGNVEGITVSYDTN
jgi:hypothetical protein